MILEVLSPFSGQLLDCRGLAKEQFAHRETEQLLTMLDAVAAKTGSRGQVFEHWLTMVVCALAGGTMEEEYLAMVAKHAAGEKGKRPVDQLSKMFGTLVEIMEETRADILGDLFQGAINYGERGQFFTPENLCSLMGQLAGGEHDAAATRVVDPCCGSGRMLLAAANVNRNRQFIGQDADSRCVRITAINLGLRNLYGYTIWGNSLTNERKLVYATGFNGRGSIRLINSEATPALAEMKPVFLPQSRGSPEIRDQPDRSGQASLFERLE